MTLEPFDESVYDAARAICAERAILGGSHAFSESATFATAAGIRYRLAGERRNVRITSPAVVAALRRLIAAKLVARVRLERRYKTRRPKPLGRSGYIVIGENP
jgi:histidinol-phosphate/aromatic aminotransferase/cobyric acid decarboxylase-like protein